MLVFDNGAFSEDSTSLVRISFFAIRVQEADDISKLTDWLAHIPKEVIAKNFGTSIAAWDHIPGQELYIFPSGK